MESSTTSDALSFEFDLRPQLRRLWQRLLLASVAVQAAVLLPLLVGIPMALDGEVVALANLTLLATVGTLVLIRGWHRQPRSVVVVGAGGLVLPSLWHWRGQRRVALADMRNLVRVPIDGQPTLFVAVLRHLAVMLPLDGFASTDDAQRFVDALTFRSRVRLQDSAVDHGITRYAWWLLGLLFGLHVLRELLGGIDIAALLHWGALNRTLVVDGEWYRLFTYALLQPNVLALVLHGVAFAVLVPAMQRAFGSAGVSLVMVVGVLAGGVGALPWIDGSLAVGMDGALYALIGAVVWTRISLPTRLSPSLWRIPVWLWMGWLMVDLLLGLGSSGTTLPLRLLGLASGCACAGLLEVAERRVRGLAVWLGVGAVVVAVAACAVALLDRLTSPSGEALALEMVMSESASLDDVNVGAWLLASAPAVDGAALAAARDRLAARLAPLPDADPMIRDTLATLHYRLGEYPQALALESQLQHEAPSAGFATQLARFAVAAGTAAREGEATVERREDRICVQSLSPGLHDVDVLLYDDVRMFGILQFERVADRACSKAPAQAVGARLEVGRVAASVRPGTGRVSYWRADPDMLALP